MHLKSERLEEREEQLNVQESKMMTVVLRVVLCERVTVRPRLLGGMMGVTLDEG